MAVEIFETVTIHEPVIDRIGIDGGPGLNGLAHHQVHLFPAFGIQGDQHFGVGTCIADLFFRKGLKPGMLQEHDEDLFTNDHAECIGTAEPLIEVKSDMLEECPGGVDAKYRQVNKNPGCHVIQNDRLVNYVTR